MTMTLLSLIAAILLSSNLVSRTARPGTRLTNVGHEMVAMAPWWRSSKRH
jgi:hypothetical protein